MLHLSTANQRMNFSQRQRVRLKGKLGLLLARLPTSPFFK
jgi:hypothetical protein